MVVAMVLVLVLVLVLVVLVLVGAQSVSQSDRGTKVRDRIGSEIVATLITGETSPRSTF